MGIDMGQLGTYGTPWVPYRFSFGRYESFYKHIPSVIVFSTSVWFGWAGMQQMAFWLFPNVFGFPPQLRNFIRSLFFLPMIGFAFLIAWIAHVMMDWSKNVESSKENKARAEATGKTAEVQPSDEPALDEEGQAQCLMSKSFIGGGVGPNGEFVEEDTPDGVLFENKMILLDSTAGRPDLDTIIQGSSDYSSTGVYMCGPEKLISGCKKAAGTTCCPTGERLQNLMKGNKFVFYEEKFEW